MAEAAATARWTSRPPAWSQGAGLRRHHPQGADQGDLKNSKTSLRRGQHHPGQRWPLTNNGIIEAGVNADNTRNANGDVTLDASTSPTPAVIASRTSPPPRKAWITRAAP
jgi:hypothetical protein